MLTLPLWDDVLLHQDESSQCCNTAAILTKLSSELMALVVASSLSSLVAFCTTVLHP